jgi:NitT/TauT family transport system permease protein
MLKPSRWKLQHWLPAVTMFVAVIALWELATIVFKIPHYLLPAPTIIIKEIDKQWLNLLRHLGWTMLEAGGGFLIGGSLAFLTAVAFVHIRLIERSLYPWAVVLQTLPIVAVSPLVSMWLGYGISHKMAIATIVSYFPVLVNTTRGLRAISPQALELMRILSASTADIFFRLRLPSSWPYVFAGLKISSTLAVIGAIVAEFTGASVGIGYLVYVSSHRLNTRMIFAGITFSSIAGIVFFQLISLLEKLLLRWPGATIEE